jgi:hypothetical protein
MRILLIGRLRYLPERSDWPLGQQDFNFSQDIVYDTSAIRRELGYSEEVSERVAKRDLCRKALSAH